MTTLIEEFHYPRRGPGQMWEACRSRVEERGIPVHFHHRAVSVKHDGAGQATSIVLRANGTQTEQPVDSVLSSIPLSELVQILDPPAPADVLEAAAKLRYRDFVLVALVTTEPEPFPDTWIYLQDHGTRAGRVQNFGAWSPDMVVPGTTCLGVEYFCFEGDDMWEMSGDEAVRFATKEMAEIGLIDPTKVVDGVKVRVPKAYPMYDLGYDERVALLREYLAGFENLKTFGRNGLHRYNNQDHSMWTAILATLNLLDGIGPRRVGREHGSGVPRGGTDRRGAPRCRARRASRLSIVVGSNGARGSVERCLDALAPQVDGAEVIVCEPSASPHELQRRYPFARFLERPEALVPALWRDGIDAATGSVVALTISPMAPAPDWVSRIRGRLERDEVVAGAIEPGTGLRLVDWAEYFCRYARDMLPFALRENPDIPGDNCAYRRELLERTRATLPRRLLGAGGEPRPRAREGVQLWHDPAVVVFQGRSAGFARFLPPAARARARVRTTARRSLRSRSKRRRRRAGMVVPAVLVLRTAREVFSRRRWRGRFLVSLPVLVALDIAWAVGEARGHVDCLRGP